VKFRKKPVTVDAIRYTGDNYAEVASWCRSFWTEDESTQEDPVNGLSVGDKAIFIMTREGEMKGSPGDWIIRGTQGEFYPCKTDSFDDTFEEIAP
jgi:hypothetical protein